MQKRKKIGIYIFSLVAIYFLIFIPACHIPVHSDDYVFYLRGISLKVLLQQYFNWEGRLLGDYTASFLLNVFSKPVYMAINSLVFLITIVNLSLISQLLLQGKIIINKYASIILWFSFFLYWLCNPNLGQTSFWLVGSAIYLWSLMWVSFFLIYYFKLLQEEVPVTFYYNSNKNLLLCVLGFLAGLSNEATGASTVCLTAILFMIVSSIFRKFLFPLGGRQLPDQRLRL